MMKYVCFIILTSFFISCNTKNKVYQLSDIKFPEDNIRMDIADNDICETEFYLVSGCPPGASSEEEVKRTLRKVLSYDKQGNLLSDENGEYKYDENNLMTFSYAGLCFATKRYHHYVINSELKVLYRVITDEQYNTTKRQESDTLFYYFDTEGKIMFSVYNRDEKLRTSYHYNSAGNITLASDMFHNKKFFYTKNRLDSIHNERLDEGKSYADKYYYDRNGLLYKAMEYTDHLAILPYSKRPLITYEIKSASCK